MTVDINTITRVRVRDPRTLTETHCVNLPRSIVTDHYLLDSEGVLIPDSLGPANNLWPIGLGCDARQR